MRNKFKNYYGLKRYLSVVAKNSNHNINFDNYSGLESIYNYLNLHHDKVSYNLVQILRNWQKKNSTDYYNIKINTEKFDIPDNFGIIYFDELEKILIITPLLLASKHES